MNPNYLLLFDLSAPNALGFLSSKYKCYSKTQTRSFSMLHEARPKRFNLNSISKTVNMLELNLGFWEVVTKRERERERCKNHSNTLSIVTLCLRLNPRSWFPGCLVGRKPPISARSSTYASFDTSKTKCHHPPRGDALIPSLAKLSVREVVCKRN